MAMHSKDRILGAMEYANWARAELARLNDLPSDREYAKAIQDSLASVSVYLKTFGWTWTGHRFELTG